MRDYPRMIAEVDHVEPVPRRVRARLGGRTVLDTTRALYVWEHVYYPQFYIPLGDVAEGVLVDEGRTEDRSLGTARRHALRVGGVEKSGAARVYGDDAKKPEVRGHVRLQWDALDAWFEEDEEVFVHPRCPYTRVDALRSTRHVRVALGGTTLAESSSPVLLFETGLPTRYYFNRTEVDFMRLVPSETVSQCPYKGVTSGYWSANVDGTVYEDLAWAYDFPTVDLKPIAGLIAFYNEKVDIFVDGRAVPRPS
ncbi:DUF427 domain-containing protein [Actinospica sp. MGRD01-02]|uniref:DUF427 domain-containing protein n=2 Tax=Actinospica acidithermotolerans TaxID=2828514 RepID=A0A941IJF1_9ACTN|nr:DUF427 domain-containing protein [Actinospica acidithermotolerans]